MTCSVCNSAPGERTRVEFLESGKEVTLVMCMECYDEFSEEESVEVVRVGD